MLVPSYMLPHRARHHAKLADTGLGPTWDVGGVSMRCRVTPKRQPPGTGSGGYRDHPDDDRHRHHANQLPGAWLLMTGWYGQDAQ